MSSMNMAQARHNMIEQQIRPWDVLDQRVLELIEGLPRDKFVPSAYLKLAYADINIPLDHGQVMMDFSRHGIHIEDSTLCIQHEHPLTHLLED